MITASTPADCVSVAIHRTAQPAEFAASLRRSFEQRRIDPKFHYTSARQAAEWLALHKKYSPFIKTADGTAVYDAAFDWAVGNLPSSSVQLLSLACGGAGKELRLVQALQRAGKAVSATVSDISVPLVIEGFQVLTGEAALIGVNAVALDLLETEVLDAVLTAGAGQGIPRVVTCFGLMPNVDPLVISARLAALVRPGDVLLVGANLVPAENYAQSTDAVLGEYDNPETRGWLSLLLADCGFEPGDGEVRFAVEACASLPELLQIVGRYHLHRDKSIWLDGHALNFSAGENLRLFFSNRYTPSLLKQVFARTKMKIPGEWISAGKTEGVIACQVTSP